MIANLPRIETAPVRPGRNRRIVVAQVAGVCIAGLLLSARGITNEGAVSLQGDMPRYLMNGVFFRDALADVPIADPIGYAYEYYARYPALSLGHHPLLLPLAEVPMFLVFGVSVWAARLTMLLFLVVAAVCWYRLVARAYDGTVALFSGLLLVTAPGVVTQTQAVLSEVPTLALVLLAFEFVARYAETGRRRDAVLFAVTAAASLYAKQLAVFMFPIYGAYFVMAAGPRRLLSKDVLIAGVILAVLAAPLVPMTLKLSRFNVQIITKYVPEEKGAFQTRTVLGFVEKIRTQQLTAPVLALAGVAALAAVVRRRWRVLLAVPWIALYFLELHLLGVVNMRFAFYALPAFCVLAAAGLRLADHRTWRLAWTSALVAALAAQVTLSASRVPVGAEGYEAAAKYVLDRPVGDSVLYSARVDTGYFVFFARKHDPERRLVVLRSDKLLTTSRMAELDVERRVERPEEIEPILRRFGIGYVVLEDTEYPDGPLRWLQELVRTDRFALRARVPIVSADKRLVGVSLAIYEYKDAQRADPAAVLRMRVPLIGDDVDVPVRELVRASP